MSVVKRERSPSSDRAERRDDLVPDETSESFRFVERAAREGRRVKAKGLTDAELRAALLGQRKDG